MNEPVRFTFISEASERSIIWKQFDNKFIMTEEAVHWPTDELLPIDEQHPLLGDAMVNDSIWPACQAVGGHRQISEIWFNAGDCNDGEHILQFDLIPMNALSAVTLISIQLCGVEFTSRHIQLQNSLTTYQLVLDPHSVVDSNMWRLAEPPLSTTKSEIVTKDLNRDNQLDSNKYYKFNWTDEQTIYGRGSWQFKFSCPVSKWFDNIFHPGE
mgnify:CR=1 FL=1